MRELLRFFRIVRPWHPLIAAALAAAVTSAGILLIAGRVEPMQALAPVFLLQALATSTGFAAPARRGHYDFLLTAGHTRLRIGLVHWGMSAAPGVASWLAIAVIELALTAGAEVSLAPGTIAGIVLVSTLPWATTVSLPRLTGGLVWILLLVVTVTMFPTVNPIGPAVRTPGGDGFPRRLLAVLLCPWILAGEPFKGSLLLMPALVGLVLAAVAMGAALFWMARANVPLETAQ